MPGTWAALWDEVERKAAAFSHLGLRPSHRLAIVAHTCLPWVIAEFAGMRAGAVIVGIDPHATAEQSAWMLGHSAASALIADNVATLEKFPDAMLKRLSFVVVLDQKGIDGASWRSVKTWQQLEPGPPVSIPPPSPDDPAVVIYTSGTTGEPKGIEYSHRQLMVACQACLDEFPVLRRPNRFICWLPMAPLFQRMLNLVAFAGGSTISFAEEPRDIMRAVAEVRPTVFASVPRFYEKVYEGIQHHLTSLTGPRKRLAMAALRAGATWSRAVSGGQRPGWTVRLRRAIHDRLVLRRIRSIMGGEIRLMLTGSAAAPVWLLEFFHGIGLPLLEAYGISENPVPVAANTPDAYRLGSVGRPFSTNSVRVAADGEIVVKGPAMFRGYLGEPLSADVMTPDGYYRTGDLGRFDEDGFLYLTGRSSEIIKTSGGRRVAPAAVEGVYRRAASIDQVVVLGDNRPFLVALIVPSAVSSLSGDRTAVDLIERDLHTLASSLAPHEQIRAFALLAAPLSVASGELTTNLKPRRAAIEARYAQEIGRMYEPDADIPAGRRIAPLPRVSSAVSG